MDVTHPADSSTSPWTIVVTVSRISRVFPMYRERFPPEGRTLIMGVELDRLETGCSGKKYRFPRGVFFSRRPLIEEHRLLLL